MRVEETLTSFVLTDSNMRILPEVLDFTSVLVSKGFSPNTIKSYLYDLRIFYLWLASEDLKFYNVKPMHIPSFIEYIDSRSRNGRVSPATLNRHLATLSSYYRHFEAIGGYVEQAPLVKINNGYLPPVKKGYLRHVTKSWDKGLQNYFRRKQRKSNDRKRLSTNAVNLYYTAFEKVWRDNESLLCRNKLIFRLLYETGFRVSELLHLQISDIDYPEPAKKTGNIYLIQRPNEPLDRQLKSGERITPVSINLLQLLDEYILYYRPNKEDVPYIFVSHSKGNYGEPISRFAIEKMLNQVQKESGIDYLNLTPHALRHTHASELQDLGVDINIIRERLGHKSIETTAKYAKPSVNTLIIAHERYLESKKDGDL